MDQTWQLAKIRLAPLFLFLAFLCFHPCVTLAKGIRPKASQNLPESHRYNLREIAKDIKDLIKDVGESLKPKDQTPPASTGETGFFISFNVSATPVTARMSISDAVTVLENYQPSYSSTYQCCTENLTCSTANCIGNNSYLLADTFIFQGGQLSNVPYMYNSGNKTLNTTGYLSFSRSPYSLLRIAQEEVFSYFFSDFLDSNVTLGSAPNATSLQSTKIVTDPNYPYLYYVNLTEISIGNSSFKFDPTTNASVVILDTVIVPTLLETTVYAKVKSELITKLGKPFNDTDSGLEVCYSTNPNWPDLTLLFPSDPPSSAAQMVLTSYNYVATVQSGAQCAAIFESEGGSVIGILAQVNRQMIFNVSNSEPRLYFSKYPAEASDASVPTKGKLTAILVWSLYDLLYLHAAM